MKCQREKFQLQRKYAYLNCAYMAPVMKKVEKAGIKGIKQIRKPFKIGIDEFFNETETVRRLFAHLIDTKEDKRVVIVPSVSYGMATVCNNLPFKSGKIILTGEQFPSNVYPWLALEERGFTVETITPPQSNKRAEDWNEAIINAIDDQTRVVAIGHVHWSDGSLFLLEEIRKRLDKVGGLLIIDGTQSVGALPFSVQKFRPDALVCAGYKWLMAPYGMGLAYYGSAFDNGNPIEHNWINRLNSEDFAGLVNYESRYREKALRYEVGEHSNFVLVPMMHTALKQLLKWTPENIQSYCKELTLEPIQKIRGLGYHVENETQRGHHLFGLRLPEKLDLEKLKKALMDHKVSVSVRGNSIRIAPHVYNDKKDMSRLVRALEAPFQS